MNRGGGLATHPERAESAFTLLLDSRHPVDDAELAELIEIDGRSRLEQGLECDLSRYRSAVPDLASRPISLDAAIDVSLRSLARRDGEHVPQVRHVDRLVADCPELAAPIRLAAVLGNQLLSTGGIAEIVPRRTPVRLPYSIGQRLEDGRCRYELLRPLGEGSNGRVFESIDHLLSDAGHVAKVAVKLIAVDQATIHRQTAEATKARRIEHPSVARVLDRGLTHDGDLFLVYELVVGGDLHSWFDSQGRRIELRRAAELVAEIARGVQAAHSAGLIHCDLKPSNILIAADGGPRVTDFGVAALTDEGGAGGSEAGRIPIGNLAFAAPEQIRQSVSAASPLVDVYALGGLLYYLATGQLPNGSSAAEVVEKHRHGQGAGEMRPISATRRDADERLDRICDRAMRMRSEDRYPTAAELAVDLEAWLDNRPIGWMKEGRLTRARLWARRSPRVALLTVLCVACVLGGTFGSGFYARTAQTAKERELDAQWSKHLGIKAMENARAWLLGIANGAHRGSPAGGVNQLDEIIRSMQQPRPAGWSPEKADE
jgi:hypothetical protein